MAPLLPAASDLVRKIPLPSILSFNPFFYSIHLYVTPMHTQGGVKEKFLKDLRNCSAALAKEGKKSLEGRVRNEFLHCQKKKRTFNLFLNCSARSIVFPPQAAVYGMAQSLPDRGLVDEMVLRFMDSLYTTEI